MIPSPIRKVLSTFRKHRVPALLIGGQACVLYGGVEFSRDVDFLVSPTEAALARLRRALNELDAEPVFLPPLSQKVLMRGHACHFRCRHKAAKDMRVDVMSVMRGCDSYTQLSRRRWTLETPGVGKVHVLAPQDIVKSKKSQQDKDWPMIARLVEADYRSGGRVTAQRIRLWFMEARTDRLLIELAERFPQQAARFARLRPAVLFAIHANWIKLREEVVREQEHERQLDRQYWAGLRKELEEWRLARHRAPPS